MGVHLASLQAAANGDRMVTSPMPDEHPTAPKVSVIIPIYNARVHLGECLDSILCQTLTDIEVLCVDDGSTDGSLDLLNEFAERDSRLTVLRQSNSGAGAARNTGLAMARGEYLSFLDADDFFEPTMLAEAYGQCVEDEADICVYGARYFDAASGEFVRAEWLLKTELLPDAIPFSYKDVLDNVFVFVAPAPWNKMFRREFVVEQGLRFQELKRANDLLFTRLALVKAQRITVVDKTLANYRVGAGANLQAANHETPLEFYQALIALKSELVDFGVFAEVERSFVNDAVGNCLYNLNSLRDAEAFCDLYDRLKSECFAALGVDGRDREYFFVARHHEQYERIMQLSPEAYLFEEVGSLQTQLGETQLQLKSASSRLATEVARLRKTQKSRPYLAGRRLSAVSRRIGTLFSTRREAG